MKGVAQDLMTRDEIPKQFKFHLDRFQGQMVKFSNRLRKPSQTTVGDRMYLKLRPQRQTSMPKR